MERCRHLMGTWTCCADGWGCQDSPMMVCSRRTHKSWRNSIIGKEMTPNTANNSFTAPENNLLNGVCVTCENHGTFYSGLRCQLLQLTWHFCEICLLAVPWQLTLFWLINMAVHVSTGTFFYYYYFILNHAVCCSRFPAFTSLPQLPVYNVERRASNVRNPARDSRVGVPEAEVLNCWQVFQSAQFVDVLKQILETMCFNTSLWVTFDTIFVPLFLPLCFFFFFFLFHVNNSNQEHFVVEPRAILCAWITDNKQDFTLW